MDRLQVRKHDLVSWPLLPVLLIAAGLLLAGVPEDFAGEDFEGPTLVSLGREHGLQLTNILAIAAVVVSSAGLLWGARRHATHVVRSALQHPLLIALLILQLAAGVTLILLSGFSTALLYWASGTFLVVTALLGLSALLKQGIP